MKNLKTRCSHCHTCGRRLIPVLDGEEWCPQCEQYRRYRSHGWCTVFGEDSPCPAVNDDTAADFAAVSKLDSAEGYYAEYFDSWGGAS